MLILSVCIFIQWQDTRLLSDGLWTLGHNIAKPQLREDEVGLRTLIAQHDGVHVEPDFGCPRTNRGNILISDIAWYAALERKSINTLYFARHSIDTECNIELEQVTSRVGQGYLAFILYDANTNPTQRGCATLGEITVCIESRRIVLSDEDVHRLFSAH